MAPDTIANFERECGVRVRYATYESNEEMLAKVLSGNSGWDVVFPTHNRISPMRQYGLLAPLDHARLTNLPNLEARFQTPPWDPHLEYCVPYMWGATGIAYNGSVTPAPAAWADLWDARLQGPADHAGRSRGGAGRVPAEAAAFVQLDGRRPACAARSTKPSRRSRCCALI